MKNRDDLTGNRTSDLPACSAVPQTTEFHGVSEMLHVYRKQLLLVMGVENSPLYSEIEI